MKEPLLTVFLLTYNHENTIEQSIKSILEQETEYPFVIKILEDCSTDKTLEICKRYKDNYPNIIELINQPVNSKRTHTKKALEELINTEYWTVLDGDDYWCDINKIQDALNFLEQNKDYNLYTTDCLFTQSERGKKLTEILNIHSIYKGFDISFDNYMYTHVSARIYRNIFNFKEIKDYQFQRDIYTYYLYLDKEKSYFSNKVTSVYRVDSGGVYSRLTDKEKFKNALECLFVAYNFFYPKHETFFAEKYSQRYNGIYTISMHRKTKCAYIWGAGHYGVLTALNLENKDIKIKAFIDKNANEIKTRLGLPVLELNEIIHDENKDFRIIIAIQNETAVKEIIERLQSLGLKENENFCISPIIPQKIDI